jgi:hypothetical protein
METPFTGGCACGALRYALAGAPVEQAHCQCRGCQRRSGTGHSSWLVFAAAPEAAVTGLAGAWASRGEGGTEKRHRFCPTCGAPVYMDFPAIPGLIAVVAASLDDPSRFAPGQVTWTSAAPPWDAFPPGLIHHAKMPPAS